MRLLLAFMLMAVPAMAQQRVVNVYNWSDYIDPYAVARFERETGIKLLYDVYDSLEILEGKLLAGKSGYDVVVPTSEPSFSKLVRSGALLPLDRAKLPNAAGLDAALMQQVATSDPGNAHGVIYLWGTIGLGVNEARLRAVAPDAPRDSWDLLFKPEWARKAARCGITMMDSAIDVIPTVLKYLGKSPDSADAGDLALVEKTLKAIRPAIRSFASGGAIETMAAGETCVVLSYSGDVIQAAARAEEAGKGVKLRYIAPQEGAQLWFDMLAIPKDAPHPAEALEFINFILRPDVMAGITNQVRYPNAIPATAKDIAPDIAGDPGVYPPAEQRARFFTIGPVPPEAARARSRLWARFKGNG
ncbi:MAG: extracellular solute-binding protein [Alphaproteobacteria bacterium]|nr:extracellular solute-binding protein [Alphaproteobacteria bacterium]